MKLKQVLILLFGLLSVVGLAWYTVYIINSQNKTPGGLIDFAVADTSSITKIRITDPYSRSIELKRINKTWTDGNGGCITQGMVHNILDVAKNIEFKGFLPDSSHQRFKDIMSTYHTKVEFFVKNKWYKTWYIGPSSQDHMGQIMLLHSEESGKSTEPVMMKVKGVYGIIEPNFFSDPRKWICTNIFAVPLEKIQEVTIINHEDSARSFNILKSKNTFSLKQMDQDVEIVNMANLYRYLHNYKKIHFDLPNYELSPEQCDSLKSTQPFCEMNLKEINGRSKHLKMYRIQSEEPQRNEFGELVNIDMNKFWCELPDGSLVKCQYHVFNPLLFGHIYFPNLQGGIQTK